MSLSSSATIILQDISLQTLLIQIKYIVKFIVIACKLQPFCLFSVDLLLSGLKGLSSSQYYTAGVGSNCSVGECNLMSMLFDRTCSESLLLISVLISFIWENPLSHAVLVAGMVSTKSIRQRMLLYSLLNLAFTCFHPRVENF